MSDVVSVVTKKPRTSGQKAFFLQNVTSLESDSVQSLEVQKLVNFSNTLLVHLFVLNT